MIIIKKIFYPCPFPTQDYIVLSVRTSLPSSYTLYFFLNIIHYFPCDYLSGTDSSCSCFVHHSCAHYIHSSSLVYDLQL